MRLQSQCINLLISFYGTCKMLADHNGVLSKVRGVKVIIFDRFAYTVTAMNNVWISFTRLQLLPSSLPSHQPSFVCAADDYSLYNWNVHGYIWPYINYNTTLNLIHYLHLVLTSYEANTLSWPLSMLSWETSCPYLKW